MKIGKIISVEYDKFRVRLFHTTRNSTVNIDGKVYYFINKQTDILKMKIKSK